MTLTDRIRTPYCVVPEDEWMWIENTHALIDPIEGEWLARAASNVPANLAIVEIGSHTGGSTLWMAAGSRQGAGAHIYAVDPWPDPGYAVGDDPFDLGSGDAVYERFISNIQGRTQEVPNVDYSPWVTPMRMTSVEASAGWTQPIGLLFIDAIHTYEGVLADVDLWSRRVVSGGWMALNDYYKDTQRTRPHGAALVAQINLEPTGDWLDTGVVWNTWVGRRR
jgi:hypothetical protein